MTAHPIELPADAAAALLQLLHRSNQGETTHWSEIAWPARRALVDRGLITSPLRGVELTDKGRELAEHLEVAA